MGFYSQSPYGIEFSVNAVMPKVFFGQYLWIPSYSADREPVEKTCTRKKSHPST